MKRSVPLSVVCMLAGVACTLGVGGCPIDPAAFEPPPAAAGLYWVEHAAGELALYRLPEYRGDPGQWLVIETDPPEWYTGPAVYGLAEDGTWTRQTEDDDLTLDDVLQLYDFPPPVGQGPGGM